MNAGQTCAAVDTLVCTTAMAQTLIPYLIQSIEQQYGSLSLGGYTLQNKQQANITRIINKKNAKRLHQLILECENAAASASLTVKMAETDCTESTRGSCPPKVKINNKTCVIAYGGTKYCNVMNRYIAPTIILNPPKNCLLMQQEIFGPILPIITIDNDDNDHDATNNNNNKEQVNDLHSSHFNDTGAPMNYGATTSSINSITTNTTTTTTMPVTKTTLSKTDILTIREKMIHYVKNQLPDPVSIPLCLYVFINDSTIFHHQYMNHIRAGSVMRNDCLVQLASPHIPFGGIGSSGNGTYHGTYSIQAFTQYVPYMYRPLVPGSDFNQLRYHPFVPGTWKYWLLTAGVMDKIPALPVLLQPILLVLMILAVIPIIIVLV